MLADATHGRKRLEDIFWALLNSRSLCLTIDENSKSENSKRKAQERAAGFARGALSNFPLLLAFTAAHAEVTYQETIRPLLQESCLNCHNPEKHKAGLDLSSYDATMDGSDNGKVVESGEVEKSLLYRVLTHAEEPYMPKGGDKLPDSADRDHPAVDRGQCAGKSGKRRGKEEGGGAGRRGSGHGRSSQGRARRCRGTAWLEPVVRTARPGAVPSVAGSPWAPLAALAAQEQVLLYEYRYAGTRGRAPVSRGVPGHASGSATMGPAHRRRRRRRRSGARGHLGCHHRPARSAEVGDEFDTVLRGRHQPGPEPRRARRPSRLVKIFSASDGRMICKMKKHTDWVTALSFTPDGKSLISGDRAGGLSVWIARA